MDLVTSRPAFTSTSPPFRIQGSGIAISTLYPTTFLERNSHKSWHLSTKTPLRQKSLRPSCQTIVKMCTVEFSLWFTFFFFFAVPLQLLSLQPTSSACLTFFVSIFWVIHQVLFFISSLKKFTKHTDTDTDTQTDRQTDRQTDTHTHTHTHTPHAHTHTKPGRLPVAQAV